MNWSATFCRTTSEFFREAVKATEPSAVKVFPDIVSAEEGAAEAFDHHKLTGLHPQTFPQFLY